MQTKFNNSNIKNKFAVNLKQSDRFTKKIIDTQIIKDFNFEKGLISKNDKENMFINYAKYGDEEVYNLVMDYYIRYLSGDYSFLDEFEVDELTYGDRVERLLEIIKNVQNTKYSKSDLQYTIKMKNIKNKALHFFVKSSRKNLSLVLIDLYHLGIYGTHYVNGKIQKSSIEKIYKRNKQNEIDLKHLNQLKSS